jgi:phage tail-like protein
MGYNFYVEIAGLVVGGFMEVSGLQVEVEVKDYQEGGQNAYVHKLPGAARYPSNLVLKRGLTDADVLWKWHQDVARGKVVRKNGSIILMNDAGKETWRWNFSNAYPVKWIGPQFNATASTVAFESLELVHTGIEKA